MNAPQPRHILLEVCIASVDDAVAAAAGGADRLELNAALALGGLTASLGTLIEIKRTVALPVIAMLRPRQAGFAYSDAEFAVMRRDLDLLLAHGADGIAFGILNPDGTIDEQRCSTLLEQMRPAPAVFHRAFDVTPDPVIALDQLIALGFQRVLTSGQQSSATAGTELIAKLIRHAADRIEVLPGGGVRQSTASEIVTRTCCTQVHASLRQSVVDRSTSCNPHISFGAAANASESRYEATSTAAVAQMRTLLRTLGGFP